MRCSLSLGLALVLGWGAVASAQAPLRPAFKPDEGKLYFFTDTPECEETDVCDWVAFGCSVGGLELTLPLSGGEAAHLLTAPSQPGARVSLNGDSHFFPGR